MRLDHLRLRNFRNHRDSSFDFGSGANILLGDNGEGKTNIIEAISYLCLTKSFFAANDSLVVNFGQEMFEVDGTFTDDYLHKSSVRVAYSLPQNDKIYAVNKSEVEPFSSVVGKYPVVICSPEYTPVTTAGPLDRRRFIDFVISQSSHVYFQQLIEYRRVLRHRNKILFDAKIGRTNPETLLEPWTDQLVALGSSIVYRRQRFVFEFHDYISSAYHYLTGKGENPTIEYIPAVTLPASSGEVTIAESIREKIREKRTEEIRYGSSLVGPHRDELLLKINGLDLRKFASQGQHKTFLVAMKVGEFFYLKDRCDETPLMLLDDVFSELDEHRAANLLRFVRDLGQTFITSTSLHFFDHVLSVGERDRKYLIREGSVVGHLHEELS